MRRCCATPGAHSLRRTLAGSDVALASLAPSALGERFAPVGALIPGVGCAVLSVNSSEPVPIGVAGELYVHSPMMFTAYIGAPDLTAMKLRPVPHAIRPQLLLDDAAPSLDGALLHAQGARRLALEAGALDDTPVEPLMYRTGDLARVLPSGELQVPRERRRDGCLLAVACWLLRAGGCVLAVACWRLRAGGCMRTLPSTLPPTVPKLPLTPRWLQVLGRADSTIKIRGFKIGLGFVEATLAALPGVGRVAVVPLLDDETNQPVALVAHVLPNAEAAAAAEADEKGWLASLREACRKELATHAVPAHWMLTHELGLSAGESRKLNRKALPKPQLAGKAQPGGRAKMSRRVSAPARLIGVEASPTEALEEQVPPPLPLADRSYPLPTAPPPPARPPPAPPPFHPPSRPLRCLPSPCLPFSRPTAPLPAAPADAHLGGAAQPARHDARRLLLRPGRPLAPRRQARRRHRPRDGH